MIFHSNMKKSDKFRRNYWKKVSHYSIQTWQWDHYDSNHLISFFCLPLSSKKDARQVDSENPMEDRSSFPAAGREETEGSKLGRSEEGPKHRSSRWPCRLRSTQLHRAQALTVSLKNTDTKKMISNVNSTKQLSGIKLNTLIFKFWVSFDLGW